jgi:RimJ/RimL family protein N-acetyltransferase
MEEAVPRRCAHFAAPPEVSEATDTFPALEEGGHRSLRSVTKGGKPSVVERARRASVTDVALRPIDDSDLDALFEQMRDPESVRMAAFTAKDPDDRAAFEAHMAKVRSSPEGIMRAITADGRFVGSIASFVLDGDTELTYWIDRSFWGQGIASRALALLLEMVPVRPVFARAASDNIGSLTVLRKAGFAVVGTEISYANARGTEIEETILRLDSGPAVTPAGDGAPG